MEEEPQMPINVRFDKNGFYHPAYGRMGRGKNAGRVYTLPDFFATEGKLPLSADIIEDKEKLEEILEEENQTKPIKPKVVDEEQLKRSEAAIKPITDNRRPPVRSRRKPSAEE
jgi:hypothetical protein